MSMKKLINGLCLGLLIFASIWTSGCGGGGGAQSGSPVSSAVSSNRGRLSLNVSFADTSAHGRYLSTRKGSQNTDSVTVTIEISGVYSVDGQPFEPIESTISIDPVSGVGAGRLEEVPIGTNHVLRATANFPGGGSATVKGLIEKVAEAETTQGTANSITTPATEAMIAAAASSGKGLHQLPFSTYETYVNYVQELEAAGFVATEITVDQILKFSSNSGTPAEIAISPSTGSANVGGKVQFSAVVKDANGQIANAAILWETDGLVGEIDGNGLFSATAMGSGSVTATVGQGNSVLTDTALVIVSAACSFDSDCDDGDSATFDFCLNAGTAEAACSNLSEICGNGTVEGGETCDDGNTFTEACPYGDESCIVCDQTCQNKNGATAYCGDGVLDEGNGETCDDGANNGSPNMCNVTCDAATVPICGNGALEAGETCDAGENNGQPNMCNSACDGTTAALCGNSVVEAGESCDGGTETASCNAECTTTSCGDGLVNASAGETCDDGASNGQPNMCNSSCSGTTSASCGNGVIEAGEDCDDGGETASCNVDCTSASCGDGAVNAAAGETCDDGANNGQPNLCNSTCDGTTAAVCGNSVPEAGEDCDGGGETAYCNADCTTASCGDGLANASAGETCDDGASNGQPNMCNSTCNGTTAAICGNSVVEAGESCDDGASNGQPNLCNSTCDGTTAAICGNTVVEAGESCDGGTETASCNADCTTASCGDGIANMSAGETCDDAGESATCNSDCSAAACGDGIVNLTAGEDCDDSGESAACDADCTPVICGDGIANATAGEACDDAGESAICNSDCTAASCGDGAVNSSAGETCDDGANNGNAGYCNTTCDGLAAVCGDGLTDAGAGESCDDGNTTAGDGCDASCQIETVTVAALAIGGSHSCALSTTGGVKCWGRNTSGQVGDGTTTDASQPTDVAGLSSGVAAISAHGYSQADHTCAVTTAGGVKCWGSNAYGQIGDGTTANALVPTNAMGLTSGVASVSAASHHTCAVTASGGVMCWGRNNYGQLGNGTSTDSAAPVNVTGLASGVSKLASGAWHTCAFLTAGGVKCWGYNINGQLGDASTTSATTPVTLSVLTPDPLELSAGTSHTCAITSSGGAQCWGYNGNYEFGNGTTAASMTPVDVTGLTSGMAGISTAGPTSCGVTTAGGLVCWGYNFDGQLGIGTTSTASTYVNVPGLSSGVASIAAGDLHSCVLLNTGAVKCTGFLTNVRPLGDGSGHGSSSYVGITLSSYCGDAIIFAPYGEQCDDGNHINGDGCDAACQSEGVCGNHYVDTGLGEQCDDGNTTPGDGCDGACQKECAAAGTMCSTNADCCSNLCMGSCF